MIEDKKSGLKIAENEDEVMWTEVKEKTETDIKNLKKMLKFNKEVLKLAESKLKD